jgi:hypothetical protein
MNKNLNLLWLIPLFFQVLPINKLSAQIPPSVQQIAQITALRLENAR